MKMERLRALRGLMVCDEGVGRLVCGTVLLGCGGGVR